MFYLWCDFLYQVQGTKNPSLVISGWRAVILNTPTTTGQAGNSSYMAGKSSCFARTTESPVSVTSPSCLFSRLIFFPWITHV